MCCSVLQRVAACCSVLQRVVVWQYTVISTHPDLDSSGLQCVTACCSVLQCVAVCCSALLCVAVCCSVAVRENGHKLLPDVV